MPGKIAERTLVDPKGCGKPYFAFYAVDTLPVLEYEIDLTKKDRVMTAMMRVRTSLAVPSADGYSVLMRVPLLREDWRRQETYEKGDRVEVLVCGRFSPGTIAKNSKRGSPTCKVTFDHPATELGHRSAGVDQPKELVRAINVHSKSRHYALLGTSNAFL